MASKSSRKQLLVPLVLAFLMVFTVLGATTPEAEAAATNKPIGKILVTTEPDYEIPRYIPMGPTGSLYYPWNAQPPSPTAQPPQLTNNPLSKYPAHPAVIYAMPKGSDLGAGCSPCFQRTVRVAFNELSAVDTVEFVFYVRDGASYPPCGTGGDVWALAMDPCLPKSIKWVPEFSYATRPGWTVTANAENDVKTADLKGTDNPAARILTFHSDTANPAGSSIGGANLPKALDIVVAFRVEGTPAGDEGMAFGTFPQTPPDEFHIQVNAYSSGDANIPFETTCPANNSPQSGVNPQAVFSCVLTNPPFDGPALPGFPGKFMPDPMNNPITCGIPGGECNGSPSLVIRMDSTAPEVRTPTAGNARLSSGAGGPIPCVCSFYSQDTDHNGHIDRFVVSFTEPINPQTFDFRQFSITTKGRDRPYTITNAFFEQQDPNGLGLCVIGLTTPPAQTPPLVPILVRTMGSTCRVNFIVAEMPFYDTGDTPNLVYPCTGCAQTVTDRAGNPLKKITGSSIVAIDRAPPVLYSVYALDAAHNGGVEAASTQMHVFFSENVIGSATTKKADGTLDVPGAVLYNDMCYMNNLPTMAAATDIIGNPGPANLQGCFSLDAPYDTASPPCIPAPKCRYFDFVSHLPVATPGTVGTAGDGWKMRVITMTDPVDANHRLMFGASDVHPFQGDMLGVRANPHGLSRSCLTTTMFETAPCDGNVRDMADNGGWYRAGGAPAATPSWPRPPANAHVTFPMVKSATVDISNPDCDPAQTATKQPGQSQLNDVEACHYWLKLQFNGPVRGPKLETGCDLTQAKSKPKPFFPCNLDIATASGTGQGPQGFLGPIPPTGTTTTTLVSQAPYFLAADSDTAILQMDHAARAVDVGLTPSRVKIHCNTVYATPGFDSDYSLDPTTTKVPGIDQQVGVLPCDDPDLYYGPDADQTGNVMRPDVDIVDRTPPRILEAKTVDADRNGYLDGIQLTFSEPVDDATYCGGGDAAMSAPTFCADTEGGSFSGYITFSRWDSREKVRGMVDPLHEECKAVSGSVEIAENVFQPYTQGFRWDTGLVANDNVGIIGHVNTTTLSDGSYITRVLDCEEYFRGAFTGVHWPSDSLLHITTPVPGLFYDLASHPFIDPSCLSTCPPGSPPIANPNPLPRVCQFDSKAMTSPTAPFNQLQNHPNTMCSTTDPVIDSVRVLDGAPPVLWKAETYDTGVLNAIGAPDKNYYKNIFGDGTIDGYRLTFSEPVSDGSFNAKDWVVGGKQTLEFAPCGSGTPVKYTNHDITIDTVIPPGKQPMRTRETDLNPADPLDVAKIAASNNDNMFILLFTPAKEIYTRPGAQACKELHAVYDTGTKPELTSAVGPGAPMFMRDRVGNPMLGFDNFAIQEEDDAGPQIVRIEGFVDTNHIDVRFSEPVDDGAHSGLVRDDFQYFDKNAKDVAGLSSTEPVVHNAGERNATLLMGQTLTLSDQATDKIAARFCRIFETAPSVPSFDRKCVPSYPRALLPENDTSLPGPLAGFKIVAELTDANSLTASWIAPGDDALGGGTVTAYECITSDVPILGLGNETSLQGTTPKFDPPVLAEPGRTQTVTIVGLDPEKTYYIRCQAMDSTGNLGPLSESARATTTRDVTPPGGTIKITSDTHPEGVPTAEKTAVFKWNAITKDLEPESTIRYHYALNQNPNYVVLATDGATTELRQTQLVPDDGDWYFHVAGVSGGGSTLTAHYHIVVGVAPLTQDELRSANDLVKTTPYRKEEVYQGQTVIVNNVTWELPPQDTPPGLDITGVDIWRNDDGVFTKIYTMPGDYDTLAKGYFVDTTAGADEDSTYKVTMVFATAPNRQTDPTSGYASLVDETPTVVPPWVWILAGVALALILSGLVIFFILRRRAKVDSTGGTAYSWESANPELLGIDEATGLPVHEVRCPSCNNPFQAVGALPLPVTCPTCGTTGELD